MNRTYYVTTNPFVDYPDIGKNEEVNVDAEEGGMSIIEGSLVFDIDGNGGVVVYAPGVWIQVSGGKVQ